MCSNSAGIEGVGIAMDLITLIWWPTKQPFEFDIKNLAIGLHERLPARGYTEEALARNADAIKSYFTVLADGRWAPNPMYFSLTNGNLDAAS